MTGLVDKVLHGDGDGRAQAQQAAQEASFSDAEAVAYGGVTPKAGDPPVPEPSGDPTCSSDLGARIESHDLDTALLCVTPPRRRRRGEGALPDHPSRNPPKSRPLQHGAEDCCLVRCRTSCLRPGAGDAGDREPPYSDMAAVAFAGSAPAHKAEPAAETAPEAEVASVADATPATTPVTSVPAVVPHAVCTT